MFAYLRTEVKNGVAGRHPNRLAAAAGIGHEANMEQHAVAKLSEMQVACLRRVAELKKTEQIAGELGISPSTVNTHIERAIARLGVANRREAARLVMAYPSLTEPIAVTHPATAAVDQPPPSSPIRSAADVPAAAPREPAAPTPLDSRPEKSPTENPRLFEPATITPSPMASTIAMGRRRNDLTIPQRLLAGLMALVLLCLAIAGLGAAIEQLSHWRASYAARR